MQQDSTPSPVLLRTTCTHLTSLPRCYRQPFSPLPLHDKETDSSITKASASIDIDILTSTVPRFPANHSQQASHQYHNECNGVDTPQTGPHTHPTTPDFACRPSATRPEDRRQTIANPPRIAPAENMALVSRRCSTVKRPPGVVSRRDTVRPGATSTATAEACRRVIGRAAQAGRCLADGRHRRATTCTGRSDGLSSGTTEGGGCGW